MVTIMDKKYLFPRTESLQKMEKEELLEYITELHTLINSYQDAYRVCVGSEYYLHRTETANGYVFYKIALPQSDDREEEFYPTPKTPMKLVILGKDNNDIPDKTRIKINAFKEGYYKKGYDWVTSLYITDFDIVPDNSKPEEKLMHFAIERSKMTEDDLLF